MPGGREGNCPYRGKGEFGMHAYLGAGGGKGKVRGSAYAACSIPEGADTHAVRRIRRGGEWIRERGVAALSCRARPRAV
jgi:hypothetical protein